MKNIIYLILYLFCFFSFSCSDENHDTYLSGYLWERQLEIEMMITKDILTLSKAVMWILVKRA